MRQSVSLVKHSNQSVSLVNTYVSLMKREYMDTNKIIELSNRLKEKRAGKGIRDAAKEIGISPATLSRIENGKIPDLDTFGLICRWTGDNPSKYLNIPTKDAATPRVQVHFKKESAINPETAKALAELILLAQSKLLEEEEVQG